MLKLDLGSIPMKTKSEEVKPKKPAWYKADQLDKDKYTRDLQDRLSCLDSPDSLQCTNCQCEDPDHSADRDSHVLDILTAMIESSHVCIPLSGGRKTRTDPSKSCHVSQSVPGWKDQVESFKQDSIFWHAVWSSAGSPKLGGLFEMMKKSRNVYHYVIRKVKKESDLIRAQKLLEASESGSVNLLLEMKKIKGSKKMKHDLPDDVGGANGEVNIVERFCDVYEELYNSSESSDTLNVLKHQLNGMIAGSDTSGHRLAK